MQKCQFCGEFIKEQSIKCEFCGKNIMPSGDVVPTKRPGWWFAVQIGEYLLWFLAYMGLLSFFSEIRSVNVEVSDGILGGLIFVSVAVGLKTWRHTAKVNRITKLGFYRGRMSVQENQQPERSTV